MRDGCTNDCDLATCGDGIQRIDLAENDEGYEGCDDGNGENSDGCLNTCHVAVRCKLPAKIFKQDRLAMRLATTATKITTTPVVSALTTGAKQARCA